jgi:hypothetical protein
VSDIKLELVVFSLKIASYYSVEKHVEFCLFFNSRAADDLNDIDFDGSRLEVRFLNKMQDFITEKK